MVTKDKDCDTCKIASYANCIKCENAEDPKPGNMAWVERKDLDIDWEEVYKKQGAWR